MNTIRRLPSMRSLRAFQVAGKHLSFKLAAEELCITASAVSHQVKSLEQLLDIELFIRGTRIVEFTTPGRKYFEFLDAMFARLESETHQLWAEYGRKMIRLCVPPFFASELLLPRMAELKALLPETDIRISTQPSGMHDHPAEADLSILLGKGDWPNLDTHHLFTGQLVVAAAPSLLDEFDNSSFSSLNGQTMIVHENRPDAWNNWARALKIPAPKPGNVLRFDSMSSVMQAVAGGLGFALVYSPLSDGWFDSSALKRVFETEWTTDDHFFLTHRPGEEDREEIAEIIDWIKKTFQFDG